MCACQRSAVCALPQVGYDECTMSVATSRPRVGGLAASGDSNVGSDVQAGRHTALGIESRRGPAAPSGMGDMGGAVRSVARA